MRTDRAVTTLAIIVAATFQTIAAQQPAWTAGGSAAAQYVSKATGDPTSANGAVVELGSSTAAPNAFGTISVKLPADAYRGRRIRVVADVAASNVSGFAAPWVRADGPSGMLMIENGQDKGLKGTAN